MSPLQIVLLILGVLLIFFVVPLLIAQVIIAHKVYEHYLTRSDKENWSRDLIPTCPDEEVMFKACEEFEENNKEYMIDLEIENDGLNLKGIYLDYGYDKAVIIVCGRTEALRYSYYFGKPYKELGYNILVIDNRSHGLSDGKYNSLGLNEYKDVLKWIDYIHNRFNLKYIIGHGSCIGAATLTYAMASSERPDYFKGLVLEGMFENFVKSFNNHITEKHHNPHFVSEFVFMIFKKKTGKNAYDGPINYVNKIDVPILYIYSKEDHYSTIKQANKIFDKTLSSNKEIKLFDKGTHSHVRVANTLEYDQLIKEFIIKNFIQGLTNEKTNT